MKRLWVHPWISPLPRVMSHSKFVGTFFLLMCFMVTSGVRGQQGYDEFLKKEREAEQRQKNDFTRYKDSVTLAYQRFVERDRQEYQRYVKDINKKWGKYKAKTSSRKEWVSYESDFSARRVVDFEKGEASVEVLVSKDTPLSDVQSRVQQEIVKMIADRGDRDPFEARQKAPSPTPVLAGQIQTQANLPVTQANAQTFAGEIVSAVPLQRESVVGGDGSSRVAARVSFSLVPNHIRVRAEQYREMVMQNAKRFAVESPLVFAVIHTESYFNPRARSSAPAYGLMQLVPQSGARAAHRHVYGEDRVLSADHLYEPSNNVELGTAYLSLLMSKDFKDVRDASNRSSCAIAAYNTGAANVAVAFVGKRKIPEAIARINGMAPEEVVAQLRSNLPYDETRKYIVNVTERMKLYEEWR